MVKDAAPLRYVQDLAFTGKAWQKFGFYTLGDPINSNLLALSVYKSLTIPRVL